ncbi:MAG: Flagellum-specific ATP synthase FliI [Brockia lithotrophica]|uniref:Flagellum-specific ATP synthase FliI n=1 Tax=Brockia lithotrophica TaxID=933949 RepID=A0A2T5G950_9BACL|nr:FliI/YscN family ATPase [Brockia lithotrophica]PTQ52668.1 MAG: Flagellum-specific ATP synthase FliI [Brockia lithotrophica]
MDHLLFGDLREAVRRVDPVELVGRVTRAVGLMVESIGPDVRLGETVRIVSDDGEVLAEVVGFEGERVRLMPLGEVGAIAPGARVHALRRPYAVEVGANLLGRVLDGLGRPIDGLGFRPPFVRLRLVREPPRPLERPPIAEPLPVGVRAIDGLLTVGRGQRVGIFAGSGVGKSTLLGMIARGTTADVTVIGLIGERGREVREFLERDLGPEGLARAVVVAVTSDEPPLLRLKGAYLATAIAEHFRDQGKDVLLLLDSVTRVAMAAREVGLAAGEPPTTKGYPPSVFALLPRLMERAGTAPRGSITAFYTVLVEGDDLADPVADHARSILDGHIVLSRSLAQKGHFPAIDVLASTSRLMHTLVSPEHRLLAARLRRLLAVYREHEDLVHIGAYRAGQNPDLDESLAYLSRIERYLVQDREAPTTFSAAEEGLREVFTDPS